MVSVGAFYWCACLAGLLISVCRWHHERGMSHESKDLWNLALKLSEQCSGAEAGQLLTDIHYGLSAAANETNDPKSCLKHTSFLLGERMKLSAESGIQDLRLAIAHNEYGIACSMNARYQEAIENYQKSIDTYGSLEDFKLAMDTNPRTNIAFSYWIIRDLSSAESYFEELLRDRELRWGPFDTESYRCVAC